MSKLFKNPFPAFALAASVAFMSVPGYGQDVDDVEIAPEPTAATETVTLSPLRTFYDRIPLERLQAVDIYGDGEIDETDRAAIIEYHISILQNEINKIPGKYVLDVSDQDLRLYAVAALEKYLEDGTVQGEFAYVDDEIELSPEKFLDVALNGVYAKLDPHSAYFTVERFNMFMGGGNSDKPMGIGVKIEEAEGGIRVIEPLEASPAHKEGIWAGDLIIEAGGRSFEDITLEEASEILMGRRGSTIELKIEREGEAEPLEFKVTRGPRQFESPVVYQILDGDIAHIRLLTFMSPRLTDDMLAAIQLMKGQMMQAGRSPAGYIIDLRDNGGGLVDQGIKIADSFLEGGVIVSTKSSRWEDIAAYEARKAEEAEISEPEGPAMAGLGNGASVVLEYNQDRTKVREVEVFSATPGDVADGKPIVVVVNEGSASASEIVAGALQDHGRVIVIGIDSFGKGSVQQIEGVGLEPEEGRQKVTRQLYYSPSGDTIQGKGVIPDIRVEFDWVAPDADFMREAEREGAIVNPDGVEVETGSAEKCVASGAEFDVSTIDPNYMHPTKRRVDNVLECAVWAIMRMLGRTEGFPPGVKIKPVEGDVPPPSTTGTGTPRP